MLVKIAQSDPIITVFQFLLVDLYTQYIFCSPEFDSFQALTFLTLAHRVSVQGRDGQADPLPFSLSPSGSVWRDEMGRAMAEGTGPSTEHALCWLPATEPTLEPGGEGGRDYFCDVWEVSKSP